MKPKLPALPAHLAQVAPVDGIRPVYDQLARGSSAGQRARRNRAFKKTRAASRLGKRLDELLGPVEEQD